MVAGMRNKDRPLSRLKSGLRCAHQDPGSRLQPVGEGVPVKMWAKGARDFSVTLFSSYCSPDITVPINLTSPKNPGCHVGSKSNSNANPSPFIPPSPITLSPSPSNPKSTALPPLCLTKLKLANASPTSLLVSTLPHCSHSNRKLSALARLCATFISIPRNLFFCSFSAMWRSQRRSLVNFGWVRIWWISVEEGLFSFLVLGEEGERYVVERRAVRFATGDEVEDSEV